MKKLLSFLVAGIAALGLASCSGDLHNELDPNSTLVKTLFDTSIKIEDFDTFELCGLMTGWANDAATNIQFVKNDEDGTWEADFLSTEDDDQGFCFITKTGKWDDYQIGGESMEAGTLPDGVKFSSKKGGGKHEDAILSGLKKKTFYKMIVDASSGTYVISIEKSTATPFYLNGYFLRTGENGADATGATVLGTPILDRKTYNVTYSYEFTFNSAYTPDISVTDSTTQVAFKLTQGATELGYYDGTFTVGTTKKPVALTLEQDSKKLSTHEVNIIGGLMNGKKYVLTITTTPEKEVSYKVEMAQACKIVGMKIENLDTAQFTDGTKIIINGGWCNWSGAWDDSSIYIGTVTSGTCEGSWGPVSVYEAGDYETVSAILLSDGKTSWKSSASAEEKSAAEAIRIASTYGGADKAKLTVAADQVNDGEYIIYVNMEGVAVGDAITWEVKAKE